MKGLSEHQVWEVSLFWSVQLQHVVEELASFIEVRDLIDVLAIATLAKGAWCSCDIARKLLALLP